MLKGPASRSEPATLADACRELGRSLAFDTVGVLREDPSVRSVTWWTSAGAPPRPLNVEDVLDGRTDGWIVARSERGALFGRLTPSSPERATDLLRTAAPPLLRSEDGVLGAPLDLPQASSDAPPADATRFEAGGTPAPVTDTLEALLERDRARLAFEIHDGMTQAVTAAILTLETLRSTVARDPSEAIAMLDDATADIRRCLAGLRSTLDALSQGAAPGRMPHESLVHDVEEVARRWGVRVRCSVEGELPDLAERTAEAAHIVVSEGLANVAKHAGVGEVDVLLTGSESEVRIIVEDRGRGFLAADVVGGNGHHGLAMVRDRIAEVGGDLEVDAAPGRGTRVVARLPVTNQGERP